MRRVLVVEDEESIRELIALNLRMAGYEVLEAGSAEKGLELLGSEGKCDAAVLDVMLPGMNGFSLCEAIRQDDAAIGIIILSAKSMEQDKIRGSVHRRGRLHDGLQCVQGCWQGGALCRRVSRGAAPEALRRRARMVKRPVRAGPKKAVFSTKRGEPIEPDPG